MKKKKFRISIIDFMLEHGKHQVGTDKDGKPVCYGDMVEYNGTNRWFVVYRYGKIMLKEVGMMAMIGSTDFDKGDFSRVKKQNVFGSGVDWLIIGFTEETFYEKVKHVENIELIDVN